MKFYREKTDLSCGYEGWNGKEMKACGNPSVCLVTQGRGKHGLCREHLDAVISETSECYVPGAFKGKWDMVPRRRFMEGI